MIDHLFSVTNTAAAAAKKKLKKRGTPLAAVRLGVKGNDCFGFEYVVQFEDEGPQSKDTIITAEGVTFLIDFKSLAILKGSTLDYVKALMYEGFRFVNPQEASLRGCGVSFTTKA